MTDTRHYDTVAFDVRDNATMLFFAKTSDEGEIRDYLLLMRTIEEDFDESLYIEINEQQFGGHNLIREAALTGNLLTLRLHEPASALGGAAFLVLCDTAARTLLVGRELPVGAITAMAGGPLFLILLRRHHGRAVAR